MSSHPVNTQSVEGQVLDYLARNSGSSSYDMRFDLGAGQQVQVRIVDVAGSALYADEPVSPDRIDLAIDFWSGNTSWFRIDNETPRQILHYHFESGSLSFHAHASLERDQHYSLSQLVHLCLSQGREILAWKYPHVAILSGSS
jgi:hypothetical protein